jgi:hypothetical protein
MAAIIGTLRTRPPINFHVMLKAHAQQHSMEIEKVEYDGPKFGFKIRSASIANVKAFAHALPQKFPHIITTAKVVDSKYVSVSAPTKYVNPMRRSPYLKI